MFVCPLRRVQAYALAIKCPNASPSTNIVTTITVAKSAKPPSPEAASELDTSQFEQLSVLGNLVKRVDIDLGQGVPASWQLQKKVTEPTGSSGPQAQGPPNYERPQKALQSMTSWAFLPLLAAVILGASCCLRPSPTARQGKVDPCLPDQDAAEQASGNSSIQQWQKLSRTLCFSSSDQGTDSTDQGRRQDATRLPISAT